MLADVDHKTNSRIFFYYVLTTALYNIMLIHTLIHICTSLQIAD